MAAKSTKPRKVFFRKIEVEVKAFLRQVKIRIHHHQPGFTMHA
jgi:hypothetical protein